MPTLTYRDALNEALREEMELDDNVFLMGEEVGVYQGAYKVSRGLLEQFGDRRVVDTPIAELGFAGIGVGAAMVGLRPVVEFMTFNFALLAIDQVVNSAAKMLSMSGGQIPVPIVFRGPGGAALQLAAQHSQAFESWYAHIPGLKVVAPATPADAKGLLKSAIRDNNPVLVLEGEMLYNRKGDVPDGEHLVPIGKADIKREGGDVTIVCHSKTVETALKASDRLQREFNLEADVVDLRSIRPLDVDAIVSSVMKTNRCVVVEEGWPFCGVGAQVVDEVQREVFDHLDAPVLRVTGADVPMPYNKQLERASKPSPERVIEAVKQVAYLAEVETDKAVMELVARGAGVLRKVMAREGTTLEVGALVGVIADADEDIAAVIAEVPSTAAAPIAREPAAVGTPAAAPLPDVPAPASNDRVKASPLARRMASERGIDLGRVHGTGPGGRIVKRDLAEVVAPSPSFAVSGAEYEDVPLTQIRKTIARRLGESIGPVPHFFLTAEIDMERAAQARADLNALGAGTKISFNDIILKVVAAALVQHRACNAWWQDDHIRYFNEVHLSVAVAVEDGLITPVVRNANRKTLREIATEVRDLAGRAREKRLTPEEYTGGTFSISNLGMYGIDQFTGVINPPEAGLLAVGAITEKPVVENGQVTVRKRMRVTMSCDHRVIDGATGAQFLETVRMMLENPLAIVW